MSDTATFTNLTLGVTMTVDSHGHVHLSQPNGRKTVISGGLLSAIIEYQDGPEDNAESWLRVITRILRDSRAILNGN